MTDICVFCGSRRGNPSAYGRMTEKLGRLIGEGNHRLVYGGGRVGLMGLLADATLAAGGEVTGVIPGSLMEQEVGHESLTRLEVVSGMLARKQRMIELSDAFIALPGGLGTMDELFEVLTWSQLGMIHKPTVLIDPDGYFQGIRDWLDRAVEAGFMDPAHRDILKIGRSPAEALHLTTTTTAA